MKMATDGGLPPMTQLAHWLAWAAFLGCSVYGHVALKVAVEMQRAAGYHAASLRGVLATVLSAWGGSAIFAWGLSALLWIVVLSRHSLVEANSISALSYALIAVAAWQFLGEPFGRLKLLGVALIALGIFLVKQSQ